MRRLTTVFLVAGLLTVAAIPSSAVADVTATTAGVRDCHTWAYYPNVLISSVRNMGCKRAARDIRRHKGGISASFRTPGGFRCRQVSGVPEGGQWRCARKHKAYRFEFGD